MKEYKTNNSFLFNSRNAQNCCSSHDKFLSTGHFMMNMSTKSVISRTTKQSVRMPEWLKRTVFRLVGIKIHEDEKPWLATIFFMITLLSSATFFVTSVWYTIYNVISNETDLDVVGGSLLVLIVAMWSLRRFMKELTLDAYLSERSVIKMSSVLPSQSNSRRGLDDSDTESISSMETPPYRSRGRSVHFQTSIEEEVPTFGDNNAFTVNRSISHNGNDFTANRRYSRRFSLPNECVSIPIRKEVHMTDDDILHEHWKFCSQYDALYYLQCRFEMISIAFQRWMAFLITMTLLWSAKYILHWLDSKATILDIFSFLIPLVALPLIASSFAEVNAEGARVPRYIYPIKDRVVVINFLATHPLRITVYGFAITYGNIGATICAILLAVASRLVIKYYESCVVKQNLNYAFLTDESLCFSRVPPKIMYMSVPLRDIVKIELIPLTTNNDSDAMCLARTAQIIRTDMFQELFSFKGSFSSKCQEKSLSLVLIAMIEDNLIVINGVKSKDLLHIKVDYKNRISCENETQSSDTATKSSESTTSSTHIEPSPKLIWLKKMFSLKSANKPSLDERQKLKSSVSEPMITSAVSLESKKRRWKNLFKRTKSTPANDQKLPSIPPVLEEQEDNNVCNETSIYGKNASIEQNSDKNQNLIFHDKETAPERKNPTAHGEKIEHLRRRNSDDKIYDKNLDRPATSFDQSGNIIRIPMIRSRTALGNYYDLNLLVKNVSSEKRRISGIVDNVLTNHIDFKGSLELSNADEDLQEIVLSIWNTDSVLYKVIYNSWIKSLMRKTVKCPTIANKPEKNIDIAYKLLCRKLKQAKDPACLIFNVQKLSSFAKKYFHVEKMFWSETSTLNHLVKILGESAKIIKADWTRKPDTLQLEVVSCIMVLFVQMLEDSATVHFRHIIIEGNNYKMFEGIVFVSINLMQVMSRKNAWKEGDNHAENFDKESYDELIKSIGDMSINIIYESIFSDHYISKQDQKNIGLYLNVVYRSIEQEWNLIDLISHLMKKILSMVSPGEENVLLCPQNAYAIKLLGLCYADAEPEEAKVEENIGKSKDGSRTDDEVVQREEEAIKIDDLNVSQIKSMRKQAETHHFQAEVNRMMKLIINSLYKNKEIFLRELISNASDALDKIRFLSLTNPSVLDPTNEMSVRIKSDKENHILHITDTGIGMTKDDLIKNLGTIAKSGTNDFLNTMSEDQMTSQEANDMIGQFGVGFYSSFLVADRVVVTTKHTDDEQHIWESDSASFSVVKDPRGNTLKRGSTISLYLKEEAYDFLEEDTLKELIRKYSQFINFDIHLWNSKTETVEEPIEESAEEQKDETKEGEEKDKKEEEDEEGKVDEEKEEDKPKTKKVEKTTWDWELMNSAKPIWTRKPSEIEDSEYNEFYKAITKDTSDPLAKTHFVAEGEVTFKAVMFVPKLQASETFNKWGTSVDHIKLYVRRVFITDDFDDMMPSYLRFVRGVVDSDDLPLNVSRETLQQHKLLKVIKKKLVRKTLDMIKKLPKEQFAIFWKEFSTNIKLGAIEDANNRSRLAKLLMFHSSKTNELSSLAGYVSRMKENQEHIYYIAGSSLDEVKQSPFVERLLKKGFEVLYLTEAVDEYCISAIPEFEGKKFQNVAKEGLELHKSGSAKDKLEALTKKFEPLTKWLEETALKGKIQKAKLSERLHNAPCALIAGRFGWTGNMERLVTSNAHAKTEDVQRDYYMNQLKTLEVNPRHPLTKELLKRIEDNKDDPKAISMSNLMFETATLRSGFMLKDTATFSERVEKLLRTSLGVAEDEEVEEEAEEVEAEEDAPEEVPAEDDVENENEETHDEL
ncbi:Endoplasmin [Nymphon striatum]|nr:Endoplasmin [Nymphon striatum]